MHRKWPYNSTHQKAPFAPGTFPQFRGLLFHFEFSSPNSADDPRILLARKRQDSGSMQPS